MKYLKILGVVIVLVVAIAGVGFLFRQDIGSLTAQTLDLGRTFSANDELVAVKV